MYYEITNIDQDLWLLDVCIFVFYLEIIDKMGRVVTQWPNKYLISSTLH
jgi:hypothetical protein